MRGMSTDLALPRYGSLGRVLHVDLTEQRTWVETVPETVYRQLLGGYGLGAWLMWQHFPTGADALAPEACFAICSGLLTGIKTPFSSRIQIVGKSPLTGTWADSNSGGSVTVHLRAAGFDAMMVRGRAATPTLPRIGRTSGERLLGIDPVALAQHVGDGQAFGRQVRPQLERVQPHGRRRQGPVQPSGADVTPRTDQIGPDVDVQRRGGQHTAR